MTGSATHIESVEQFDQFAKDNEYVMIDFYADWCPPCKAIAPLYAKLADANSAAGKLAFVKVNVDDLPDLGERYEITAMPTFLFLHEGEPTAIPVPGVKGGGAKVTEDGVHMILGADPRALVAVSEELGRLAKESGVSAVPEAKPTEEAEPAKDTQTVSGSYSMGVAGQKRSDWKMSLSG